MKIPKIVRKSKYFIKALLKLEYPRRSVYDFMKRGDLVGKNTQATIPKICFFSWKTDLLTRSHYSQLKYFVEQNSNFDFYFFTDEQELDWMIQNFKGSKILDIYKRAVFGASKSDIFRTCILFKHGGIFFSVNKLVKIPLLNLIGNERNFIISFDPGPYIRSSASERIPLEFRSNSVIQWCLVSPPDHKILKIAIDSIVESSEFYSDKFFSQPKEAIWNFDGPYMLARSIDKYLADLENKDFTFAGVDYHNSAYVPTGSEYRYAQAPSYLGAKNSRILVAESF